MPFFSIFFLISLSVSQRQLIKSLKLWFFLKKLKFISLNTNLKMQQCKLIWFTNFYCVLSFKFCFIKTLQSSNVYRWGHLPFIFSLAVWESTERFTVTKPLKVWYHLSKYEITYQVWYHLSWIPPIISWSCCKNFVAERTCLGTIKQKN